MKISESMKEIDTYIHYIFVRNKVILMRIFTFLK